MPVRILAATILVAGLSLAQQPAPDPQTLASIEGIVLGANQLPLSETTVSLIDMTANDRSVESASTAISNIAGGFSFADLKPGHYAVLAQHPGYTFPPNLFTQVTLAAGQHLKSLALTLLPMTVLSGKVTDEDGNPMKGVTVRPMQAHLVVNGHLRVGNGAAALATGADGKYDVSVAPGRWYLSAVPPRVALDKTPAGKADGPELAYVTTYYPGVRELPLSSAIESTGAPMPEINVQLRKTAVYHVRGKVTGELPPDLRIVVSQETGNATPGIIEDGQLVKEDGTFDVTGLTPGEWILNVRQYGKVISMGFRTVRISDSNIDIFSIPIQQPANLDVSVKTVPASTVNQNARFSLQLTSLGSIVNDSDTVKGGDGTYTLKNVEAGNYRVDATPPSGGYVKSVIFDGQECIDSGIHFTGESGAGLQVTISMTAGEITGTVVPPDGGAPTTAIITVMPDGPPTVMYRPELYPALPTDAGGHFAVKNLPPGTYRVYAWKRLIPKASYGLSGDRIAFADPDFPRAFDSQSAVVTIGESESKQVSLTMITAEKMEDEARRRR